MKAWPRNSTTHGEKNHMEHKREPPDLLQRGHNMRALLVP
jgi:hypothetical protein